MKNKVANSNKIKKLTLIAIFCALAYVCSVVFPIKVAFLTLDFKDAVSTICGLFFGPAAGFFCAFTVPFIELLTSDTGFYGLIMNLLSSVTFVGVSAVIYKYKKTMITPKYITHSLIYISSLLIYNLYFCSNLLKLTNNIIIPS